MSEEEKIPLTKKILIGLVLFMFYLVVMLILVQFGLFELLAWVIEEMSKPHGL